MYAALVALGHGDSATAPALVAVRSIEGGRAISAADVEVASVPLQSLPEGALVDPAQAVGRTALAALPRRGVLTTSDLLTGGSLVGAGRVALPVTLGGGAALGLIRVGDRIDLLGASNEGSAVGVVATGVRVVAIPPGDSGLLPGSPGDRVVLIEVDPDAAARISAAATVSTITFALH